MPVINKSDHWDNEFERLNPEMTVKRVHSLKELKDLGFDVKSVLPNDQADPRRTHDPETQLERQPALGRAPCSASLSSITSDTQKTISSLSPSQITLESVTINAWRSRFPKLSDLLLHVERYPNVWWVLERMRLHRLRPLLDQWQKEGRPNIEWLEPSEYQ